MTLVRLIWTETLSKGGYLLTTCLAHLIGSTGLNCFLAGGYKRVSECLTMDKTMNEPAKNTERQVPFGIGWFIHGRFLGFPQEKRMLLCQNRLQNRLPVSNVSKQYIPSETAQIEHHGAKCRPKLQIAYQVELKSAKSTLLIHSHILKLASLHPWQSLNRTSSYRIPSHFDKVPNASIAPPYSPPRFPYKVMYWRSDHTDNTDCIGNRFLKISIDSWTVLCRSSKRSCLMRPDTNDRVQPRRRLDWTRSMPTVRWLGYKSGSTWRIGRDRNRLRRRVSNRNLVSAWCLSRSFDWKFWNTVTIR